MAKLHGQVGRRPAACHEVRPSDSAPRAAGSPPSHGQPGPVRRRARAVARPKGTHPLQADHRNRFRGVPTAALLAEAESWLCDLAEIDANLEIDDSRFTTWTRAASTKKRGVPHGT